MAAPWLSVAAWVARVAVTLGGSFGIALLTLLIPCVVTSGALRYCPMKSEEANRIAEQVFWSGFGLGVLLLGGLLLVRPLLARRHRPA